MDWAATRPVATALFAPPGGRRPEIPFMANSTRDGERIHRRVDKYYPLSRSPGSGGSLGDRLVLHAMGGLRRNTEDNRGEIPRILDLAIARGPKTGRLITPIRD